MGETFAFKGRMLCEVSLRVEIALAEMMFLCLGANCAPSLWLQSCQMLSSAGGPQRGVREPRGERKDSGRGAAGFSTFQWEAGLQGGTEKGLEDL